MKSMLLSFFVLLSLSQLRASDTLTIRQVFNFNVGDTFDYRLTQFNQCVGFSTTAYVRKIVIQKSYSIAQDTIYYQYNLPLGNGSPFFYVSQFDTITNLDSFAIHLTDSILSPGNTGRHSLSVNSASTVWRTQRNASCTSNKSADIPTIARSLTVARTNE